MIGICIDIIELYNKKIWIDLLLSKVSNNNICSIKTTNHIYSSIIATRLNLMIEITLFPSKFDQTIIN